MYLAYLMRRVSIVLCTLLLATLASEAFAQPSGWQGPARKGRKYKVRIDSAPQMAAIYLEDEKYGIVGYTPWNGTLAKGDWNIILKKDGYELSTRRISVVRSRQSQETFVPMVKREEPAVVEVTGAADQNAFGAKVWVDGQLQGEIPATIKLDEGRHLVEIKKDGFRDFSQWIQVKEGERQTVNPMLKEVEKIKPKEVGSVLVDSDVSGADVYLDGNKVGDTTPTLVPEVTAGPHVVEVRKEPALPWRQTVQVEAGKTVKVSAELKATMGGGAGNVRVLSNVESAVVYLDGKKMGKVPFDLKKVSPGEHVIEVKAEGYQTREQRVTVGAGTAEVLKLDLAVVPKSVGGLRFVSTPSGSDVLLDGEKIGTTPLVNESVGVGEHIVTIRRDGYFEYEDSIKVEGGKITLINANLKVMDDTPSDEDIEKRQKGLTSYGARVIPKGNSAIDFAGGFPYFLNLKVQVGAGDIADFGFDAGVLFRSFLSRSELGLTARLNLVDQYPFSVGMFAQAGGGANFVDNSQRTSYFFDTGLAASLTGLGAVTITARGYANFYTDRHCPGLNDSDTAYNDADADGIDVCDEYLEDQMGGTPMDPDLKSRIDNQLLDGPGAIFDRDNGVRIIASLAIEIAIKQRWNIYLMFEGAPFQEERAAFTGAFSRVMFDEDPMSYLQLGITYKF